MPVPAGEAEASPLHTAAANGQKEVVELLITKGANVDAKGRLDWTPLFYAVDEGHKEVAELLLDQGARVDASDPGARESSAMN